MQFDWFTFVAQIINFVVLLILLQRFLYKPILQTMRAREEQIAARFEEAESQGQQAQREAELFREKRQDLESQRSDLLAAAVSDAQQQRKQLLDEARSEVDGMREQWLAAIAREKASYLHELRKRVSEQVFMIARRALKDLATSTLEEQIVTVFCQRLQQLDKQEKSALAQAIQNSQGQAVIRTVFGLNETQKTTLIDLLHGLFDEEIGIVFEEAPDLLCGIELQAYGHRISWSLHDYVETLEQRLDDLFEADGKKEIVVENYSEAFVAV
ncbi:F0F1 ATP synthase subunit B [Chloroflexi bacterium TSY]|nr:F0F1 ATP synthase subunit B [Chloroflexi bacterium TSY]